MAYKLKRATWWRFQGNITGNVIAGAIAIGIISGIFIGTYAPESKIIYQAEAKEVAVEKKEIPVLIEVKIDWTQARIEEEIRKVFVESPEIAVAIAMAESQMNPKAYNPEAHIGCKGSLGIMQLACIHNRGEDFFDPAINIKKAHEIYKAEGWEPWGAYTDGRYKQYMK